MRRLLLVRHASTAAVRAAAFGADEALDATGVEAAARLAGRLPRGEVLISPARRAAQTAAGLDVARVEPALAECDFGDWAGLALAEVASSSPELVHAWMTDPDAAPHGGESLTAMLTRVRTWLEAQAKQDGTAIAITHGGVVKAAVVIALDAPPSAFWRIDVSPVSITELHAHDGRWTVTRVNDREARATARGEVRRDEDEGGAATGGESGRGAATEAGA
jgi:broad specificity phosphatase PhoE